MREPPHNLEAEQAVLGAPLISPRCFREVIASELRSDDFFVPAHRSVYEAYQALDANEDPIDVISLADELRTRGAMPRLEGGESYLVKLADTVPTAENVGHYVKLVKDKSSLRRLLSICAATQERIHDGRDPAELIEELSADVSRIVTGQISTLVTLGDLVPQLMQEFEDRVKRAQEPDRKVDGIRFGLRDLDDLIFGLKPENQCVIAAPPGGGKTALAVQAALVTTVEDDGAGLIFSMEMSPPELVERAFAHWARVNSYSLRRGELKLEDFQDLTKAATKLHPARLSIDGDSSTLGRFWAVARRWRAAHPNRRAVIVFDFIQLADEEERRGGNRAQFIGDLAKGTKKIAKDLDAVSLVISQLNREGTKKGMDGKLPRPSKGNLKESGDIEAAADLILLIHNEDDTEDGPVDLIVDKFRGGMCRTVKAHWEGRFYKFRDLDGGARYDGQPPNWQDGGER